MSWNINTIRANRFRSIRSWPSDKRKQSRKARSTLNLGSMYPTAVRRVRSWTFIRQTGREVPCSSIYMAAIGAPAAKTITVTSSPTFVERGATVVLVEYDLCPKVTVTDIVRQTRAAIAWVYRNIIRYSGNPSKLYVSGHSAGGHLTAMALAHDWDKEGLPRNLIKGAVATSGVYDLDMVMQISVNEQVRMTPEIARENSPSLHPPLPICPVIVAVGGAEPKGWQQMSEDYFRLCKERGLDCEYLVVPGANHYTMSEHLADANSPLAQAMFKQMGL